MKSKDIRTTPITDRIFTREELEDAVKAERAKIAGEIRLFNDEIDHSELGNRTFRQIVTGAWWQALKSK